MMQRLISELFRDLKSDTDLALEPQLKVDQLGHTARELGPFVRVWKHFGSMGCGPSTIPDSLSGGVADAVTSITQVWGR